MAQRSPAHHAPTPFAEDTGARASTTLAVMTPSAELGATLETGKSARVGTAAHASTVPVDTQL